MGTYSAAKTGPGSWQLATLCFCLLQQSTYINLLFIKSHVNVCVAPLQFCIQVYCHCIECIDLWLRLCSIFLSSLTHLHRQLFIEFWPLQKSILMDSADIILCKKSLWDCDFWCQKFGHYLRGCIRKRNAVHVSYITSKSLNLMQSGCACKKIVGNILRSVGSSSNFGFFYCPKLDTGFFYLNCQFLFAKRQPNMPLTATIETVATLSLSHPSHLHWVVPSSIQQCN